jgi:hypothetical protein
MNNVSNDERSKSLSPRVYSAHRLSLYGSLGVLLAWLCYVIYLVVANSELPDGGEALSVVTVGLVLAGLGWAVVRIMVHFGGRLLTFLQVGAGRWIGRL